MPTQFRELNHYLVVPSAYVFLGATDRWLLVTFLHCGGQHQTGVSSKGKILSIATDAELLWLRHAVLQSAGFDVLSTQSEAEAFALIQQGSCQAVVLGHSLSARIRVKLAEAARQFCPLARIIEITNVKRRKAESADALVYGFDGPEALIDAIRGHRNNHS